MTLNEVMKDTADAIREKTGKSEKIAPINFAEEIKSISAGGGESGGSDWHYFDISNAALSDKSALYEFGALVVKLSMEGNTMVGSASMGTVISFDNCVAFGLDMSQKSNMGGEMLTYKELYAMAGLDSFFQQLGIVEITKEQFYDLNA